jgi:recombination protein RecA
MPFLHKKFPDAVGPALQPGGRITAENMSVRNLVRFAFQVQDFQLVGGPDWLEKERFDILAKAEMRPDHNTVDPALTACESEGEIGDAHMGLQARLMSQALRILNPTIARTKTTMVFINQIREKIGVMFGNPETTTGGRALKFYSSVRADIRRIAAIKEGEVVTGNRTKIKIVKNKMAPPFREAEFDIIYGEGISKEGDLIDLGAAQNLVEKSGAWYSYKGERIGQGRENARQFLKDNPEVRKKLDMELRKALGLIRAEVPAPIASPPAPAPVTAAAARTRG